jgi:hypothetical protein
MSGGDYWFGLSDQQTEVSPDRSPVWGKLGTVECCLSPEFREARFWTASEALRSTTEDDSPSRMLAIAFRSQTIHPEPTR